MIFNFKTAEKVIVFYNHLIGQQLNVSIADFEILNIVIAPEDETKLSTFLDEMQNTTDYNKALSITGYNPNRVNIMLLAAHKYDKSIRINLELDQYLRKNHLSRVYLNPYYFDNQID